MLLLRRSPDALVGEVGAPTPDACARGVGELMAQY